MPPPSRPFFQPGPAADRGYVAIRDLKRPPAQAARCFVEDLWSVAAEFVDPRLPQRARHELLSSLWELYLAAYLLRGKHPLVPWAQRRCMRIGPDLQIGALDLWIEATAPGPGTGPDAAPEMTPGRWQQVPSEQILLRIRFSLSAKLRGLRQWQDTQVVREAEPFVVAINGRGIPCAQLTASLPWPVVAVFPLGDEYITVDGKSGRITAHGHHHRPALTKASGATVNTTCFLHPDFAGISAILYSTANPHNPHDPQGHDFVVVHNPRATAPLPRGVFDCWEEYWVEGEGLNCRPGALNPLRDAEWPQATEAGAPGAAASRSSETVLSKARTSPAR